MTSHTDNVKLLRIALKMSQQEVAEYLEITRQTYQLKESGNRAFNDKEKIKLKELFIEVKPDITIDQLFFEDSKQIFQ